MAYANSRQERIYTEIPAAFGLFNNSAGASTIAGANNAKFLHCRLKPATGMLRSQSKTGTRSVPQGVAGKRGGTWELEFEFIPNGTAGTAPDIDPVLRAIFGVAPTIVAVTSVTYNLSDTVLSFNLFDFRQPSTVLQRAALGCVVERFEMTLNQDVANIKCSGPCISIIDTTTFASQTTLAKGGLTSFPTEPGSPVTNGSIVPGFVGSGTYDGNAMTNIASARITGLIGNSLEYAFGNYEPNIPGGDTRNIAISTDLFDDDTSNTTNLYTKSFSKAAIQVALLLGAVAGSRITGTLKGVQLPSPDLDDGQRRWMTKFGDSQASGSSVTALDEFALAIT